MQHPPFFALLVTVSSCLVNGIFVEPPPHLVNNYTFAGKIPLEYFIVDDSNDNQGSHYVYSANDFDSYVKSNTKVSIDTGKKWVNFQNNCIPIADNAIYQCNKLLKQYGLHFAMVNYSVFVKTSTTIVFGSTDPWVEATMYVYGSKNVTTLDYNKLTFENNIDDLTLKTISVAGFSDFYSTVFNKYDLAVSMSSFDHDGLGRYGDPINPDGDLLAMNRAYQILKPGGLLFLSVPIGPDLVVFNLHRRYGRLRLPMLLASWEVLDRIGWDESRLDTSASWRSAYEPVFVLRKPMSEPPLDSSGDTCF